MEVVYKNANVSEDISGLVLGEFTEVFEDCMAEETRDVIPYAGDPSRFLFGTDWPICSMKSYPNFVRQLNLAPEAHALLMADIARRLFRIEIPGAARPAGG